MLEGICEFSCFGEEATEFPGAYVPAALRKVIPPKTPSSIMYLKTQHGKSGDVFVAKPDQYHAITNNGEDQLVLVSVIAPEPAAQTYVAR